MDDENHPSQDDENQETEIGNEEVTENEEQASSENEEALEDAPQNEENSDANEDNGEGEEPELVEEQQPRKQSRTSKRIQQLNAQKKEALIRAERAEQQLKQYQQLSNEGDEDYDEYDLNSVVERTARKTAEITQQQSVETAKQEVAQLEHQELTAKLENFQEAEAAIISKVPDYEQVTGQLSFIAQNEVVSGLILESEKGPEVAYYLGKNPNEARAVASMSPLEAAKHIGGIEVKLTPPAPKKATTAPKPVPKISGKSGSQSKDPSKMSMKEYEKWRMGNS